MLIGNIKKREKTRFLKEKIHNIAYNNDKSSNYYDAIEKSKIVYFEKKSKVSKIGWFDNIKNIIKNYIKPQKKINKIRNEYQTIIDEINSFHFNSENMVYINKLLNNFKLIDNPSHELQEKYKKIIEYRNILISKDTEQFKQNIKEISDKIQKSKNIKEDNIDVSKKIKEISDKIQKSNNNHNNHEDVAKKIKDISDILSNKEKKKNIDINNYATMDYFGAIRYEKNNDSHMKFSKAISIIRDKNLHQEDEWKEAIGVLSSTFGNGKAKESNIEKKLNDFNKTEKLLSSYGRKIKNNTATNEEKLIYNALLYHLANCDFESFSIDEVEDYINDYIIEEADRYIEDVKKYQKKI